MDEQQQTVLLKNYLDKTYPNNEWKSIDLAQKIHDGNVSGMYVSLLEYKGITVRVQIMGATILVDGKDITGSLGDQTTYGDYSPIVQNNQGTFNNGPKVSSSIFSNLFVTIIGGIVVTVIGLWLSSKLKK